MLHSGRTFSLTTIADMMQNDDGEYRDTIPEQLKATDEPYLQQAAYLATVLVTGCWHTGQGFVIDHPDGFHIAFLNDSTSPDCIHILQEYAVGKVVSLEDDELEFAPFESYTVSPSAGQTTEVAITKLAEFIHEITGDERLLPVWSHLNNPMKLQVVPSD